MARTESTMLELGSLAPDFNLPEPLTGENRTLNELKGNKGTLVVFMCNHCPYVLHILPTFVQMATAYQSRDINVVAISSNDIVNYGDDSPENMAALTKEYNVEFPYLYDESQMVAKAYQAACTPDFYLFDDALKLVYRGQFDGSRPGNDIAVSGEDLSAAVTALAEGRSISAEQVPSLGCNVKWKAGNEPEYFS